MQIALTLNNVMPILETEAGVADHDSITILSEIVVQPLETLKVNLRPVVHSCLDQAASHA
jgi:hypothetical protein